MTRILHPLELPSEIGIEEAMNLCDSFSWERGLCEGISMKRELQSNYVCNGQVQRDAT